MKFLNMLTTSVFRSILIATVISFFGISAYGQSGFTGALTMGVNAAQIDGDGLYGYDKLGLNGGVRLGYPIGEKSSLIMELLYSQRGSTPDVTFSGDFNTIDLKYIEIPVLFQYNDWYMEEDDYYKVGVEGGIAYGNLFSINTSNTFVPNDDENYRKYDFSYTLGLRYNINARWSGLFRYNRSFHRIYVLEDRDVDGFVSHWLSFRIQYHL